MQVHVPNASEFGVEKVYCLYSRNKVALALKILKLLKGFHLTFKSQVGGEWGHKICDQIRYHSLIDSW